MTILEDFPLPACTVAYNGPITKAERWRRFHPRPGDILICSPAKCGTSWMQAICGMLVSGRHDPDFEPAKLSPWIDASFIDIDAAVSRLEQHVRRRYFKTHTPLDGIPYYAECTYIAIHRDPRDALISLQTLAERASDETSRARLPQDIHAAIRDWLSDPRRADIAELPTLPAVAHHFSSFWQFRHLPNIHLFHYADLVRDLPGSVRAIAAAIAQPADEKTVADIAQATAFETMRENARRFAPAVGPDGGNIDGVFFRKGAIEEWRGIFSAAEVAAYRERILEFLPQDAIEWIEKGDGPRGFSPASAPEGARSNHVLIPTLLASESPAVQNVEAAAANRDLPRAIELARKHLDEGLEHPLLLNLRAYWHEAAGRTMHSLVDLNRASLLAPGSAIILNSLGLAYARQHQQADALRAFNEAVAIDPAFAPAQFNKGWASEDMGELAAAKNAFAKAAELTPGSAVPRARLAALAVRMGDWTQAREAAAKALSIDSSQPVASAALANVELAEGNPAAAERRMREFLSREAVPADRAYALTVLGDALHAQHRFKDAFGAYAERNTLLRTAHADRFSGGSVEPMPRYLGWMCDYIERIRPASWGAASQENFESVSARRHVFVLGFARSGTTLVEESLASNRQVCSTQEREAMADSVRAFMASPRTMDRLGSIGKAELEPYREDYWRRIRGMGIDPDACVVVDKQPFNTIRLPLIAKLFPSADVVYCVRDPRDVVLSCFRRQFQMTPSTFELLSLEAAARFYDATMKLGSLCEARLPLRRLTVRHEDVLADFEGQMQQVCAFVGLPWEKTMLHFSDRQGRRPITTPSATQIAKGLDTSSFGQWRNYRDELAPVMDILRPWVERFGYAAE